LACGRGKNVNFVGDMRKIVIFTGTRADWGILSPVARALRDRGGIDLTVAATNMHLSDKFGHTVDEIVADGFTPLEIPMDAEPADNAGRVAAMAQCMEGTAALIVRLKPDLAVILGDRFEMLSVASACLMTGLPIAHISGGETTLGAVDNSIRHAITQMASLHLTATEAYRRKVIELGANPALAINTGALGVYNIGTLTPAPPEEMERVTGMKLDRNTVLVTYHPATLDPGSVGERVGALTSALDSIPGLKVLVTAANNDARGAEVNALMREYVAANRGRVSMVDSLGRRRYHTALRMVGVVVGNSSSGIVEVPSAGIPTVDIGVRQKGRIAADSVIHCGDSREEILRAVEKALSPQWQQLARGISNPYYQPDTLDKVVRAIAETPMECLRDKDSHLK